MCIHHATYTLNNIYKLAIDADSDLCLPLFELHYGTELKYIPSFPMQLVHTILKACDSLYFLTTLILTNMKW